jgi:hypothetical protein
VLRVVSMEKVLINVIGKTHDFSVFELVAQCCHPTNKFCTKLKAGKSTQDFILTCFHQHAGNVRNVSVADESSESLTKLQIFEKQQ